MFILFKARDVQQSTLIGAAIVNTGRIGTVEIAGACFQEFLLKFRLAFALERDGFTSSNTTGGNGIAAWTEVLSVAALRNSSRLGALSNFGL